MELLVADSDASTVRPHENQETDVSLIFIWLLLNL